MNVASGRQVVCRLMEVLGIPQSFPVQRIVIEADCRGMARVYVSTLLSVDRLEGLTGMFVKDVSVDEKGNIAVVAKEDRQVGTLLGKPIVVSKDVPTSGGDLVFGFGNPAELPVDDLDAMVDPEAELNRLVEMRLKELEKIDR